MPKIPVYESQVAAGGLPPARNATGADFGAEAMDGVRDLGRAMQGTAAIVQQKVAEDDVTNVRVKMAEARAAWDVKFRDASASSKPGDPNFAGSFTQSFKDFLAEGEQIPTTREGQHTYKLLSAELTGHFAEKAGMFAVQSAGVKARNDWDVSQRAYATSIITDPTSYSSVLNQAVAELRDPNGTYGRIDNNTRSALEMKARDTLAQAYVNGLVDNGAPELARKILMDGKLDDQLEPKDKQRLIHSADAGITAKRVALEHGEALAKKEEKDRIAQINDDLMGKFAAGKLTMGDVRNAGIPAFGDGSQHTWVTMLKQQAKDWQDRPARTESTVYSDVLERIRLPYGDTRKITNVDQIYGLYGKGLSSTDTDRMVKKFRDDQSDEGHTMGRDIENLVRGVKPQLDKSTFISTDTGGADRVAAFRSYVEKQVEDARKANVDPRAELLNRKSPKWLGNAVQVFQTDAQRVQAGMTQTTDAALGKSAPPRKTLDEIFKR